MCYGCVLGGVSRNLVLDLRRELPISREDVVEVRLVVPEEKWALERNKRCRIKFRDMGKRGVRHMGEMGVGEKQKKMSNS